MRANPLVGLAIALTACLLFVPAAHAQDVGDCPDNTCVESQTSLVFNPATNTMDAFTTATTDYNTSYWYDLCVNLAVMRVNGPYVVNWDILWPSTTPSSCVSGAVELEDSASVAATPGRQYFAEGLVELYVFYTYSDITYPDCGDYCTGYWYDAEGYSLLSTSQPSNANWPSIEYSYPYLDEPEPVASQSLAMMGSGATAWAPPVIYSVNGVAPPGEAQLPVGAPTPVTIVGAGFGYSPTLTISGNGVTGYTNPCASSPSSSCDSTIMATVTIDANTPTNSQETITVMAGGQNPSGFLPVATGSDPNQQATAQATTKAAPAPHLSFTTPTGGSQDVTNNSAPVSVTVGQQIALTVTWDAGASPQAESWVVNDPQGSPLASVVGNYTVSVGDQSLANLTTIPIPMAPTAGRCQASTPCFTFYFVWAGTGGEQTQTVVYNYTLAGVNGKATAKFDVNGPVLNPQSVATTFGTAHVSALYGLEFGDLTQGGTPGVTFTAPNPLPLGPNAAPGPRAIYQYVQLITGDTQTQLPYNDPTHGASNPQVCRPSSLGLDNVYPFAFGPPGLPPLNIAVDSPTMTYPPTLGERLRDFSATIYLMWDPGLPAQGGPNPCTPARTTANAGPPPSFNPISSNCASIPVPLVSVQWEFKACFINTLNPSGGTNLDGSQNGTTWSVSCGVPKPITTTVLQPSASNQFAYPQWSTKFNNLGTYNCQ